MAVTHFRPLRPATCLLIAFLIRIPTPAHSADPAPDPGPSKTTPVAKTAAQKQAEKQAEIDRDRQATAVALNYCRASFHRIRKQPTKQVMLQEQTQILNNLNLSGIADREVIQLYTAVLDEIHSVQIAEKERMAFEARHRREFHPTVPSC